MISVHTNPVAKTDKMFSIHTVTLPRSLRAYAHMAVVTSAFLRSSVFGVRLKIPFQCGRKAKPDEKSFQTYPDQCGRGLSTPHENKQCVLSETLIGFWFYSVVHKI